MFISLTTIGATKAQKHQPRQGLYLKLFKEIQAIFNLFLLNWRDFGQAFS
jgi:hypothetical protein